MQHNKLTITYWTHCPVAGAKILKALFWMMIFTSISCALPVKLPWDGWQLANIWAIVDICHYMSAGGGCGVCGWVVGGSGEWGRCGWGVGWVWVKSWLEWIHLVDFNPLRAKFFRGNINIYLHFMSLLHIDMTQVLKILPQVRPGLVYST